MNAHALDPQQFLTIPIGILSELLVLRYARNQNSQCQIKSYFNWSKLQVENLRKLCTQNNYSQSTRGLYEGKLGQSYTKMNEHLVIIEIYWILTTQMLDDENDEIMRVILIQNLIQLMQEDFKPETSMNFLYIMLKMRHNKNKGQDLAYLEIYQRFLGQSNSQILLIKFINQISPSAMNNYEQAYKLTQKQISDYAKQPSDSKFTIIKAFLQVGHRISQSDCNTLRIVFLKAVYSPSSKQLLQRLNPEQKFMILKLIQLFHVSDLSWKISQTFFSHQIPLNYQQFQNHIYNCFCNYERKGASVLAVNIYISVLNQQGLFFNQIQLFVDLYLTLDSYGTHLIKDVWKNFYKICQQLPGSKPKTDIRKIEISLVELFHCLLNKISMHTNNNIPKYCIQDLLQQKSESFDLFEYMPETVYSSLLHILNNGAHYHDCILFHHDSKMYPYIRSYYLKYYQTLHRQQQIQDLIQHQRTLLESMHKNITFEHSIIAFVGVLAQMPKVYPLQVDDLHKLTQILQRFYKRLTVRKRFILLKSVCQFLGNNLSNGQKLALEDVMRNFILKLPELSNQTSMSYIWVCEVLRVQQHYCQQEIQKLYYNSYQQYLVGKKQMNHCSPQEKQVKLQQIAGSLTINLLLERLYQNPNSKQASVFSHTYDQSETLIKSTYFNQYEYICYLTVMLNAFKLGARVSSINIEPILIILTKYYDQVLDSQSHFKIEWGIQIVKSAISLVKVSSFNEAQCKAVAKLIEYCTEKVSESNQEIKDLRHKYELILVEGLKSKLQNVNEYQALEDSLYITYNRIVQGQWGTSLSSKNKLRIEVMLFCILSHDTEYMTKYIKRVAAYEENIMQYCQMYDFQHYQQLFLFIILLVKTNKKLSFQNQFIEQMSENLIQVIETMLHNLDYGVHKKQVVSASQCAVQLAISSEFSDSSVNLLQFLLKEVGHRYWGFQRQITFSILNYFTFDRLLAYPTHSGLCTIIFTLLQIEEYRGQDSAILLYQHRVHPIYDGDQKMNKFSDYDGSTLRFATIHWIQQILNRIVEERDIQNKSGQYEKVVQLWKSFIDKCTQICAVEAYKEKMFLTGTHKTKLKIWQALLAFPLFINNLYTQKEVLELLDLCLEVLAQNNLVEVRHYVQVFTFKLIYNSHIQFKGICQKLKTKILQIYGQTNLLKNITYIVISGMILQFYFEEGLYTALFANICSHIAYFRGLSQYFCYKLIEKAKSYISNQVQIQAIQILYREFLKDEDAVKLTHHIQTIVQQYKASVHQWNIRDNLFSQKVTLNGQVISGEYYVEQFKKIGQKLVKQNKNEDGFMPYRQMWKTLGKRHEQEDNKGKNGSPQEKTQSFQKKIDPSLDDLYNFKMDNKSQRKTSMKVIVVSSKNIPIYGHLARVGEILGLQTLCIPSLKIIELDEFKNVSCTAQKWLHIVPHNYLLQPPVKAKKDKNKPIKQQKQKNSVNGLSNLYEKLSEDVLKGYQIACIEKSKSSDAITEFKKAINNVPQKMILLIDECNYLPKQFLESLPSHKMIQYQMPLYLSTHVDCTIILWQYFRHHILRIPQLMQN